MAYRILMVCLGNICRSPAAEGAVRLRATAAGLPIAVDSAGTGGWHVGAPPHPPMIRAAARRGIDIAALRARQFNAADFARFDLILAMDRANLAAIEALRPAGLATPVELFLQYAPRARRDEVPDPYYSGDYEGALNLIEDAADGLLNRLRTQLWAQ